MKTGWKKIIKAVGYALMLIAIVFIVKKIMAFDDSIWVSIKETKVWVIAVVLGVNITQILISCIPWGFVVKQLTGTKIPYLQLAEVYTKSNIYKYIPGNIFQYVGRNELAVKMSLSHADIGMSTLLDTMIMFGTAVLLSFCILGNHAVRYFSGNYVRIFLILAVIAAVMFLILWGFYKKSGIVRELVNKYKGLLNIRNFVGFVKPFLFYIIINIVGCITLILVLLLAFHQQYTLGMMIRISGAYIFAFIVGLVTPGVSGGIGIRESVMVMLTDGFLQSDVMLASMVLVRLVSVFSDIASFGIIKLVKVVKALHMEL